MQGQALILIALFITVTHETIINFFDAQADIPFLGNQSTVYATHIELWTNVTECPSNPCSCQVQTNVTIDDIYNVTFLIEKPNIGRVQIDNLQPDTLYSFTLTCEGTAQNITHNIRTDYGRPSAPQNITVILNSKRLRVVWLPPLLPAGPIHNYKLTINQNTVVDNLPNDKLSYDMIEDYVYGMRYTFNLVACNKDRQNTVCSRPNESEASFFIPTTTTTASEPNSSSIFIPTTTTASEPNSSSILSYSISFLMFIFCFLVFSQMKY